MSLGNWDQFGNCVCQVGWSPPPRYDRSRARIEKVLDDLLACRTVARTKGLSHAQLV